ncbi:hypothetical protein GOODEAATRI_002633 [Goodea atripinnis]|uniref:Uncharacterized protein n=1 Tax=Goodea atripinnis TaxID=208336 RepID=A0ABV0PK92_9TELE
MTPRSPSVEHCSISVISQPWSSIATSHMLVSVGLQIGRQASSTFPRLHLPHEVPVPEKMVAAVLTLFSSSQYVQPDEQLLQLGLQNPGANQVHIMAFSTCNYTKSIDFRCAILTQLFGLTGIPGPTHSCIKNELRVENYLVTLLDVGGSAESRGVWRELYGEAHGVIFVVDSSDRQRMKEAREVLADLLKQPRVAGKPILV